MMNVYLDHAATTKISTSTKNYIIEILDMYGNPSSNHILGIQTKKIIEDSRKNISKFINSLVDEVIFTTSGSASNTLGIKGFVEKNVCKLFYSPTLHKSAIKCIEDLSIQKEPLKVNSYGEIDIDYLKCCIASSKEKPFIVVEYANSEIGTIQDVKKIVSISHAYNGIVYLDCTASISTIKLDVHELGIDMCGFSGHKLGALKGCGVLYKKKHITLSPLVYGSQEQGLFGGTENVIGIASLGKAVEEYNYSFISSHNRDYVYKHVIDMIPNSYLIGSKKNRLPHNLYICFKNVNGESLMLLMDMNGIQVSTGSACNSSLEITSNTLLAINMNKDDMQSCIRMTFDGCETKEELDYVVGVIKDCVGRLRKFGEK